MLSCFDPIWVIVFCPVLAAEWDVHLLAPEADLLVAGWLMQLHFISAAGFHTGQCRKAKQFRQAQTTMIATEGSACSPLLSSISPTA